MIRKLKIKFVALAMMALFVLLTVIVIGMNVINYNSVVAEANAILSVLSQNKGVFPEFGREPGERLPHNMSPETPYESRYFSVLLGKSCEVISVETGRIASVDTKRAIEYAQAVVQEGRSSGFMDEFRFVLREEAGGCRIIFLDCGRNLDSLHNFFIASSGMALAGFVVVFFVIFIFSGRIIRPIAESYEKQKQFITDASHEIKTPLTIINANVDILEMELGENESLTDIAQQTKRLRSLTDELVLLSHMEERGDTMQKIEFPISEVAAEAVRPFRSLALQQDKELVCNIQPMLTLKGNNKSIEQLVNILMDNALKYSPPGGTIVFNMEKQTRAICLSVYNATQTEINKDQLGRVFERFFRTDSSRNSETGGHGIGLSVAKAIVNAHGGKINARTQDGRSFQITAVFPI